MHPDAEQLGPRVRRLEAAPRAAAGNRAPLDLVEVENEPAVVRGQPAFRCVVDLRLAHGADGTSAAVRVLRAHGHSRIDEEEPRLERGAGCGDDAPAGRSRAAAGTGPVEP